MGIRALARHAIPGSTAVYSETRLLWKARSTRRRVKSLLHGKGLIKLDIGAGDAIRSGWITLDITNSCDLFWDLRRGIPFPDNSVDVLYSSHLLEHMPYQAGQDLLHESRRVLKPGGLISVCVPDARLYIDAYLGKRPLAPDHDFWEPALISPTGLDLVNYIAYMDGEHACLFDIESLLKRLQAAGFVSTQAREFDPHLDLPERRYESIYAEARKPQ